MKKIYVLWLTLLVSTLSFGQVFYSENIGSPAAATSVGSYTGWQNTSPITYTGTASARTTAASAGYTGASGSGNVFFANAGGTYLQIGGINSSAYPSSNIQLSFGYLTTTTTAQIIVEYSTDGTNWSPLSFTNNSTTSWTLATVPVGQIPSSTSLSLRFTGAVSGGGMRIDDIKLTNVSATCSFVYGAGNTSCDASTLAIDTYTATIAYTGAGNATYTVTATAGTVGGDNPTSTAAGTIVITGIPEGTNITVNVTGGTCNSDFPVTAPACKPINFLPYYESFNYTAGNILTNEQRWTTANSGDNILAAAGNLNYTGLTSSGNSATFDGGGAEAHSPFTATTSGELYASFLMKVTDNTAVAEGGEGYFAVLTDGVFNNFKARIFIKKTGTTYQLGLTSAATTTNYTTNFFNVGDVVYVVMGYDFATNTLKAWFNPTVATFTSATPADLTDTPATAISTLGGFLLRQDSTNTTPFTIVDELRIATSINQILGITENNISGLSLYPNPANDVLHITTKLNSIKNITIYDVVGKQVLNTTTSNEVINVASLNPGIYMVKIIEEGKTATRKLVIK